MLDHGSASELIAMQEEAMRHVVHARITED
jgi:hypothetical protein